MLMFKKTRSMLTWARGADNDSLCRLRVVSELRDSNHHVFVPAVGHSEDLEALGVVIEKDDTIGIHDRPFFVFKSHSPMAECLREQLSIESALPFLLHLVLETLTTEVEYADCFVCWLKPSEMFDGCSELCVAFEHSAVYTKEPGQ